MKRLAFNIESLNLTNALKFNPFTATHPSKLNFRLDYILSISILLVVYSTPEVLRLRTLRIYVISISSRLTSSPGQEKIVILVVFIQCYFPFRSNQCLLFLTHVTSQIPLFNITNLCLVADTSRAFWIPSFSKCNSRVPKPVVSMYIRRCQIYIYVK